MRDTDEWVVIDTETTGLSDPVWAVEIAAQRMRGWRADGEPFRVLLNHDVEIEPEAEALHGYSRAFLRKHGENPATAHEWFRSYAGSRPVISYNRAFDWNRVLVQEFMRLRLPFWESRGFCAMVLARRLLFEAPNLKLDTLRECFPISRGQAHRAQDDVQTIVELFRNVLRERLHALGVVGYDRVAAFAARLPVTKCVEDARAGLDDPPVWHVLADGNKPVGPFRMRYIAALADGRKWMVSRRGMDRWVPCGDLPEFAEAVRLNAEVLKQVKAKCGTKAKPKAAPRPKAKPKAEGPARSGPVRNATHDDSTMVVKTYVFELIGLLKGIMADGVLDSREIHLLSNWMQACPCTHVYPVCIVADQLERILADGVVTAAEQQALISTINEALAVYEPA